MTMWFHDAAVYHLFPLGALDAPEQPRGFRLLRDWATYITSSGYGAVLLGPIWQASNHGYDTVDYRNPDPRLGTWEELEAGVIELRKAGLRIVLDTVFNHSGRDFFAFKHILNEGPGSPYWGWYRELRVDPSSPGGVHARGWNGNAELPQFDLNNPAVCRYHLETLDLWMSRLDIDGLRLDAADVMDPGFLRRVAAHCRACRPDIWLLGEIVHGDYGAWLRDTGFDSVTNYELYKSLWSSHRDQNYYELAWTLNRLFGENGLCRGYLPLSFADNHDVTRIADQVGDLGNLYPLLALLVFAPGIPSTYYGSEVRQRGVKGGWDDWPLRPYLSVDELRRRRGDLREVLHRLLDLRNRHPALRLGTMESLENTHEQIWFRRTYGEEQLLIAVTQSEHAVELPRTEAVRRWIGTAALQDLLNDGDAAQPIAAGQSVALFPRWARVFRRLDR